MDWQLCNKGWNETRLAASSQQRRDGESDASQRKKKPLENSSFQKKQAKREAAPAGDSVLMEDPDLAAFIQRGE